MVRVTRAEAARMLNLHRSTITRWTERHPALLDAAGLVDPVELQRHRDAMVNPKLQTRGAAARGEPEPLADGRAGFGGNPLNGHRARGEAAKAISAELDLAARLKETLVQSQVESAGAAAFEILRQTATALAKDRAEALSCISDPRAMEHALSELLRVLLEMGATALTRDLEAASA